MKDHGNLNSNDKPHHLYEIRDSLDDKVFKFGISHDPIDENGYSDRMLVQVNFLNLGVNWPRFFGRILLFDIDGRKEAKRLERDYIKSYKDQNEGERPRGNLNDY
jgi:hypothetical protein